MGKANRETTAENKAKALELFRADSFTKTEICEKLGISRYALYDWLNNDPEFAAAVKQARQEMLYKITCEARVSLRKLVQGYTAEETTIISVPSKTRRDALGNPLPEIKEQKTIRKPIPPNTGAVIFALTNGDPDTWKQRQVQDISAKVDASVEETKRYDLSAIPDEELQRIADLIQESEHEQTKA